MAKQNWYSQHKARVRARQLAASREARDLAPFPPVENPQRRAQCAYDLRRFCETYCAERFSLTWSRDHLDTLARMQHVVLHGGLQAIASPRGDGKTSRAEAAALWALLYGHRRFVVILAAERELSRLMLRSIVSELETSALLCADFPEVCIPLRALSGIRNRAPGQLYNGEPTRIRLTAEEFILPTSPGSVSSGAVLWCRSVGAAIRGVKHRAPRGAVERPDLVLVDDFQTDASARSAAQCTARLSWLLGTVRGMAGPDRSLAAFVNCTVIEPDDAADQLLDHKRYPQWSGLRYGLMRSLPRRMDLWDEWWALRSGDIARGGTGRDAQAFYAAHRAQMDAGAEPTWAARVHGCASAVEYAMRLFFEDRRAFWAEYQNQPLRQHVHTSEFALDASQISRRTSAYQQWRLPVEAQAVTAFIDIQRNALFYTVVGWTATLGGYVCDYGVWPPVATTWFALADLPDDYLQRQFPGRSWEAALVESLDALVSSLTSREFLREDGTALRLQRLLIDAGWGESTAAVRRWCRQSRWGNIATPSHGRGIGPAQLPLSSHRREPGSIVGEEWRLTAAKHGGVRQLIYDTNYWKTRVARALTCAVSESHALLLFAADAQRHALFAEHCCAETPHTVIHEGTGRRVIVWRHKPTRPDNHYWDCVVGAMVAASLCGIGSSLHSARPRNAARVRYLE